MEHAASGKTESWGHSRAEQYRREKRRPPMVNLTAGQYLLDCLMECGPILSNPMGGFEPLTWAEINGYKAATGAITEPWEARCLSEMSRAYLQGFTDKHPLSIPPMKRKE